MSTMPAADAYHDQFHHQQATLSAAKAAHLTPRLDSSIAGSESPRSATEESPDGLILAGSKRSVPDASGDGHSSKPKQKRNKPTLSCEECVERKTKVRIPSRRRSMSRHCAFNADQN